MKNTVPLIVATILGLLAVFAVSRAMSKQGSGKHGKPIPVLVANGNLKSGDTISAENFREFSVPLTYLPKQHILNDQRSLIVGQTLVQDVASGDYLLWNDIGQSSSIGEGVGEGEWAVSVKFENPDLVRLLKSGDEIAILGMFDIQVEKESNSSDANAPKEIVEKTVTTTLFPQVRIMSVGARGGSVLLSLPPEQALAITAAQREAKLFAALRRPHDDKATNRKNSGVFETEAFVNMLEGCNKISIPDQPFNRSK